MANLYKGDRQGRQAGDIKPSRFRPQYRQLSDDDEKAHHDGIKATATALEELIEELPDGRYKSLALTALEESVMWAVKQLTA